MKSCVPISRLAVICHLASLKHHHHRNSPLNEIVTHNTTMLNPFECVLIVISVTISHAKEKSRFMLNDSQEEETIKPWTEDRRGWKREEPRDQCTGLLCCQVVNCPEHQSDNQQTCCFGPSFSARRCTTAMCHATPNYDLLIVPLKL